MSKVNKNNQPPQTNEQVEKLNQRIIRLQEQQKRAQADYQNLVRRNREEKSTFIKFATKDLLEDLITPIEHLSLAASQIKDKGLDMVISQLWQKLQEHGLMEINPLNQKFDPNLMEAAEGSKPEDEGKNKVTKVIHKGYKLNGEVIRFAKVIVE